MSIHLGELVYKSHMVNCSELVVLKILILKLANKRRSEAGPTTVD